MRVSTEVGMVERDDLLLLVGQKEEPDNVILSMEWRTTRDLSDGNGKTYPAGTLVRRDVWVNSLRGLPPMTLAQGG
jgi:hypothetical protein